MKHRSITSGGSLDMLLDTMCNTFGGVCFIALMIAIITASLPTSSETEENESLISEQMIVDKEAARLTRERDELQSAVEIQKTFLTTNSVRDVHALSEAQLLGGVSSNATALAKLSKEKQELEDRLAKLTTDISYSTREAMRLERLLKELEERLGKPENMKNRAVRTPVERELAGYNPIDVWIHNRKMYFLDNNNQVECNIRYGASGRLWDYRIRPSAGYVMERGFFESLEYCSMIAMVREKNFVRIYSDSASFAQLCDLRDDLIRRRKMYNWHVVEDDVLQFVEGHDGRVQ